MSDKHEMQLMELLKQLGHIDYIKPGTFPNIDLYMDQVTTFMNEHLTHSKIKEDEKILTKTMINNYAKNDLLPPPVNKKYSREHMIVLTFIYYFKSILSISEIQSLLGPLTDRFFNPKDNPGHISMEDIYDEIFASIKSQLSTVSDDVTAKLESEKEHFTNVKNTSDREFLQTFSMICMLGFDVFLKKQIIESLVDSLVPKPPKEKNPKKDPKKQPAKK
ncbi:MAG: DUF1836 domain-containing protein [Butyrivibrio sp.]